MTTVADRITRPHEYEVLRRFAAGMGIVDIAKATKLPHEEVSDVVLHMARLQRGRAGQLVRDHIAARQQRFAPTKPVKRTRRVRVVKEPRRAITAPPAPAVVPPTPPARMAAPAPGPAPSAPVSASTGPAAEVAPGAPTVVAVAPVLPAAVVDELRAAGMPTRVLYACTRCPCRYRHAYRDHGAPKRCPGRLLRVEVRDA